jgi:serine/threonine protein phosphatase PrpC
VSGDHAVFFRDGDLLLCSVIDGIGHGPPACEAAERAAATVLAMRARSPVAILAACDAALTGTRGVVMAVAAIDEARGTVEHASVGNIGTRLEGYRQTRSFVGTSSALGPRSVWRRPAVEAADLERGEALVLFTDGITSRATLVDEPALLREHPIVIAQHLFAGFARATDDALVMVVR